MTETQTPFHHPETGVPMTTKPEFQAALHDVEERLAPLYRERYALRQAFSERFEPELPSRVYRTDKQALVARCPRCGGQIKEEA